MKKALILSYYFPPYNGIEGNRPYSWSKNFSGHDIYCVVLTRHWSETPKSWQDYYKEDFTDKAIEKNEGNKIIRLPYIQRRGFKFLQRLKAPLIFPLYYFLNKIAGNLQIETDACYTFYKEANELLKSEKFDIIITTSPPLNIVKLGHRLSQKYEVPFIADFRDNYNNEELRIDYNPKFSERLNNKIYRYYLRKWLRNAKIITSVCQPIVEIISRLTDAKKAVIYNGYEEDIFENINGNTDKKKFTISCVGTVYPYQEIEFMLEGFKLFLKDKGSDDIQINFVGVGNHERVKQEIANSIDIKYLKVTDRIPRNEALSFTKNSNVLYYPGWPKYRGRYSGKIFEYLASSNNILIAPSDNDVLDDLIKATKAGKLAYSPSEMSEILNEWYQEWKVNGKLEYGGLSEEIRMYTREVQSKKLVDLIKTIG